MIEPIKPIINKFPVKHEPVEGSNTAVKVTEWGETQNGWDYGEGGLVGKLNEIIEAINKINSPTN